MTSDEERREAARRLREIRLCKSGHIEWWKIAQAIGLKEPAGWFGWEKFEPDSVKRLADLIEPSCDRDALLALADDMDLHAKTSPYPSSGRYFAAYARRIREALWVED